MTDDDATPAPTPTVGAILADAWRVLAEDVSAGPWEASGIGVRAADKFLVTGSVFLLYDHGWLRHMAVANARVMAAARRLLEHAIEAVEDCGWCEGEREPADLCPTCRAFLADILAATGRVGGEGDETEGA